MTKLKAGDASLSLILSEKCKELMQELADNEEKTFSHYLRTDIIYPFVKKSFPGVEFKNKKIRKRSVTLISNKE